jgi:hypothetical protein
MKLCKSILVLVFANCGFANAECTGLSCADVKIHSMQVDIGGTVWIQTTGTETGLSCTPDSNAFIKFDSNAPGGKNIYSGLLAYKLADKPLGLRIVQNSNPCELSYIVAN